jgi:hypothetical protein
MAVFNRFNCFSENLAEKVHNLGSDTLRVLLTNTVPNIADVDVDTVETPCVVEATSNAVEIVAGNGYTKKGESVTITGSAQVGGTYTLAANDVVWTAGPAAMATFRYCVLYNDTGGAAATRPVIGWWDYGVGGVTLLTGETFTIDFTNILTITPA